MKLGLVQEAYTMFILFPFCIYFLATACSFEESQIIPLVWAAGGGAFFYSSIGALGKYFKLRPLLNLGGLSNEEMTQVKIKLLEYPVYEAVLVLARWLFGLSACWGIMILQVDLTPVQSLGFLIFGVFSIPFSMVLSTLAAERMLIKPLSCSSLTGLEVDLSKIRGISNEKRAMFQAASLSLLPLVMLGHFLWLSQSHGLKFENVLLHLVGVGFLTLLAISATLYETYLSSKKSNDSLYEALNEFRMGTLTDQMLPVFQANKVGFLNQEINKIRSKLRETMIQVGESSSHVQDYSQTLNALSAEITQATNGQSRELDGINSAIEEISQNIASTANSTKIANELAQSSRTKSVASASAIESSFEALAKVQEHMKGLESISKQTNLLAINAGIEASHAGEHGVGFGVIATSVRALSVKSGEVIRQLSSEVSETLAQSRSSLEVLRDMLPEVENVTQIMGEISSASQEEDTAIQYIADSINAIADSSKATSEDSEGLLSTAEKMNEDSQNLKNQLKFFKFEE